MEEHDRRERLVVVATYRFRHDAEVARAMLGARGIEAQIEADDCGGMQPAFAATSGVTLMVRVCDAHQAQELLDEPSPAREPD